ncbi:jg12086 [Pararge aegeria aegeria]|uniref:Jg12086 protein n=1 Tax=Pararge aegeria aegeria TaxID=348720 RepID=A0A8S4QM44_9NEOP|nr:jg12086 [Pararge aegeria aegeria]
MSSKHDEFISRISILESERKNDKLTIHQLEEKIENLERKTRCTGIEIRNIPKSSGETKDNMTDTVKSLGKALKIDLIGSDIRDVYRINTKDGSNPIIAELSSVLIKEKILSKVKQFNKLKPKNEKLNTSHLKFAEPIKPIFISETLTQNTQKLYFLARSFQKNYNYSFCWTSRGVVYLRKNEKSPQIKICMESDIEKLRKTQ